MEAEDLVFHHCSEREIIKKLCEGLPHVRVSVLAEAFVVEPVNLSDLARFVVSAQNCDSVFIPYFERY